MLLTSITLTPHARAHKWTPVTIKELETFLGLILLTGIMDKKKIADYWRTKPPLQTLFFNQTMPRNRFHLISSFLHFNNNDAMPSECTDKLYKIRPIFETLVEKWQNMCAVGEHIAIDKAMLKWRGRLFFCIYNKDKPTKYGIKAYILADSASGYCWNLDIYHCKGKLIKETVLGMLSNKCLRLWLSLYEVCSKSIRPFSLSPIRYEQTARAKRGCTHTHSRVIVKRFRPIRHSYLSV